MKTGKVLTAVCVGILALSLAAPAIAKDQKRERKRDGTCQSLVIGTEQGAQFAKDQKRERKRDGTCQSYVTGNEQGAQMAKDQKRDRKRDGTCKS